MVSLNISRFALFALIISVFAACAGTTANDGSDPADTQTAADSQTAADTKATDTWISVDIEEPACFPTCKPWTVCDLNAKGGPVCVTKPCKIHTECNAAGGPSASFPEHWCLKKGCVAWQCSVDGDCATGNKCNQDDYRCYVPKTGCDYDAQCVDDKICTLDTCDSTTRKCLHKQVNGCCEKAADCDDGVACTTDLCTKGTCQIVSKNGCCTDDANCADSSPCTVDRCVAGACTFTAIKDCCQGDGNCDDGLDSTVDTCAATRCVNALAGMSTSCKTSEDCKGNSCAVGVCVGGACSWSQKSAAKNCCVSDVGCQTDTTCKRDTCVGFICKITPVVGIGVHSWQRFESAALTGWTVTKGNSIARFYSSTLWPYGGKRALRYGIPDKKTWSAGFPNKGSALSPGFTVPKGKASLRFQVFFDGQPGQGVHIFGARIVDGAGKKTDVWSKNANLKGNTAGKWVEASVSLQPWLGKVVRVEFWFDVAVSFPKEDGFGLLIDEVRVSGACP